MTHVYFHCSNPQRVLLDPHGRDVEDLSEARDRAIQVVREIVNSRGADDWRSWTLHVSDDSGAVIFVLPFAYIVGRPH